MASLVSGVVICRFTCRVASRIGSDQPADELGHAPASRLGPASPRRPHGSAASARSKPSVPPSSRTPPPPCHHSLCSSRSSILFHSNREVLLDCNGSSQQRTSPPPPTSHHRNVPPLSTHHCSSQSKCIHRRSPWTSPLVAPLHRFEGTSAACSSPSTRGLRHPCFSPSHVTHGSRHLPLHGVAPTRPSAAVPMPPPLRASRGPPPKVVDQEGEDATVPAKQASIQRRPRPSIVLPKVAGLCISHGHSLQFLFGIVSCVLRQAPFNWIGIRSFV